MKYIRQMFLCLICLTLVACGGSGSDETVKTINASNASAVLMTAVGAGAAVEVDAPYLWNLLSNGVVPVACDAGTVEVTHNDLDGNGVWGHGEDITLTFSQCTEVNQYNGSSETVDGVVSLTNVTMTGDKQNWPADYSIGYDIKTTNLAVVSDTGFTQVYNVFSSVLKSMVNQNRFDTMSTAYSSFAVSGINPTDIVGTPLSGVTQLSLEVFDSTFTYDELTPANTRFDITVGASNFNGTVHLTAVNIDIDPDVTLSAEDGSNAMISYVPIGANPPVTINIDEDNDGVYESTIQSTADDLGLGGFDLSLILLLVGILVVSRKSFGLKS